MNNILFISCNGIKDDAYGGPKGTIRNFNALKKYGNIYSLQILKRSNFHSLISVFEGYYPPISNSYLRQITRMIKEKNINIVFFDQSFYGSLVKKVKKLNCQTIVFCHNCEVDYNQIRFSSSKKNVKRIIYSRNVYLNEKSALKNADKIAVFLQRDADRINELYGVNADCIIPLGAEDIFRKSSLEENGGEKYCLLLGPAYESNLMGARWFAHNVAPYITCKTVIAGKDFDKYARELQTDKITVKGYVEDVSILYNNASLVAIPQLMGSGMKVKTIEAMMFGKYIVGTAEAFAGFVHNLDGIGNICDTKEEFINAINSFLAKGRCYNPKSRALYLSNYSLESCQKQFDSLMEVDNR